VWFDYVYTPPFPDICLHPPPNFKFLEFTLVRGPLNGWLNTGHVDLVGIHLYDSSLDLSKELSEEESNEESEASEEKSKEKSYMSKEKS